MSPCQQLILLKIESMLGTILLKYEPVSAIYLTRKQVNVKNYLTQL